MCGFLNDAIKALDLITIIIIIMQGEGRAQVIIEARTASIIRRRALVEIGPIWRAIHSPKLPRDCCGVEFFPLRDSQLMQSERRPSLLPRTFF